MGLLRRDRVLDAPENSLTPEVVEAPATAQAPATGKGRPTPKRREAEKRRPALGPPPANRREAYKRRRAEIRTERRTARRALMTGDVKNLPPRDAGPVRALVRDIVDSRPSLAGFALLVIFASLGLGGAKSRAVQNAVLYIDVAVIGLLLFDFRRLARKVRDEVTKQFGAKEAGGLTMYAVSRALQFRPLRRPPPRVRRGQSA